MANTSRKAFLEKSAASMLALSSFGVPSRPAFALRDAHTYTAQTADLNGRWHIQSSKALAANGAALSTTAFDPVDWYEATIPSTVFAAIVRSGRYGDPFYGMDLRSIPGVGYPIGAIFSNIEMPAGSPYRSSWWYRTTFDLAQAGLGKHVALQIDGVNYRANAWLNGRQIASADQLAGMWRAFEYDVTHAVRPGTNVLAFEVFAPTPDDLALTFVDWNPMPPDKDMGLYRGVRLHASGGVTVRNVQVVTHVARDRKRAALTVYADLRNVSSADVAGRLRVRFEDRNLSQPIVLRAGEARTVIFSPSDYSELLISDPELWWPFHMGAQPMRSLDADFEVGGEISDRASIRFGMREVTSAIDERGHRLFSINGERMLVLGAGWTPDMLLRTPRSRQEDEIRYVRDVHLNTIRLEGKICDDAFFDLCDRYGIMVMAGWCCCDRWEEWPKWNAENYRIAGESLRTQVRRLRNHPSLLTWAYGSDNAPPPRVERIYLRVLHQERWPNPYQAAASARNTLIGTTGVKMTGPYDYVAPSYWLDARAPGGADGFNSETSPGAAVPPLESLRRFIPAQHLWPIDEFWNFHAGSGHFKNLDTFTRALEARYGKATGVDDYTWKAQLMTYEGERAMFEAFRRNKYASTGVIQWMLNNAWPGLIWHLYDYYLRPGGGYFGTKKACEPLHVQYSYDDRSVVVTNELHRAFPQCAVRARVFDVAMRTLFNKSIRLDVPPDSATRAFELPVFQTSPVHFVQLDLESGAAAPSSNFYWLSAKRDVFDWSGSTWYYTPLVSYADFSALESLPKVPVKIGSRTRTQGGRCTTHVRLDNPSAHLAFFVHVSVRKGSNGDDVLPVFWSDNYVTLLPGARTELQASYRLADLEGTRPSVAVSGWNAARSR